MPCTLKREAIAACADLATKGTASQGMFLKYSCDAFIYKKQADAECTTQCILMKAENAWDSQILLALKEASAFRMLHDVQSLYV